jgi:hypothetical protein
MSGLTASILGISHALIYFPLYEHWKMFFKRKFEPNSDKLSSRYIFLSAIFSKCKKWMVKIKLKSCPVQSHIHMRFCDPDSKTAEVQMEEAAV